MGWACPPQQSFLGILFAQNDVKKGGFARPVGTHEPKPARSLDEDGELGLFAGIENSSGPRAVS